jgi:Tol biopolymer transport system component
LLRCRKQAKDSQDISNELPPNDTNPAWSPDAKFIVFSSTRNRNLVEQEYQAEIYRMPVEDSSNPIRLTETEDYTKEDPVWSPTCDYIVFTGVVRFKDKYLKRSLYKIKSDTSVLHNGIPLNPTDLQIQDQHPAWLLDSQYIFFDSGRTIFDKEIKWV